MTRDEMLNLIENHVVCLSEKLKNEPSSIEEYAHGVDTMCHAMSILRFSRSSPYKPILKAEEQDPPVSLHFPSASDR